MVYGHERLLSRGLNAKRSLALREIALGVDRLERFVRREPLRRVHECAFGVLRPRLESEPVDPCFERRGGVGLYTIVGTYVTLICLRITRSPFRRCTVVNDTRQS